MKKKNQNQLTLFKYMGDMVTSKGWYDNLVPIM